MGKRIRSLPALHDLDVRKRIVDSHKDYQQILSYSQPPIEAIAKTPAQIDELCRIINDGLAEIVGKNRDHFPGLKDASKRAEMIGTLERIDHIVPIASGCVGSCTYCITKEARGAHVSSSSDDVIRRIDQGARRGLKEILLTSQDTGAWGADLGDGRDLPHLMRNIISNSSPDIRVRIGMMNPQHLEVIGEELIEALEDVRFFKFLHYPTPCATRAEQRNR